MPTSSFSASRNFDGVRCFWKISGWIPIPATSRSALKMAIAWWHRSRLCSDSSWLYDKETCQRNKWVKRSQYVLYSSEHSEQMSVVSYRSSSPRFIVLLKIQHTKWPGKWAGTRPRNHLNRNIVHLQTPEKTSVAQWASSSNLSWMARREFLHQTY
jgi:hypothetical protein